MQIEQDDSVAEYIYQKLENDIFGGQRPKGGKFHVTSLINPRYAYFERTIGHKVTRTEIGFFVLGRAVHEYIQRLLGNEFAEMPLYLPPDIVGTADYIGSLFLEIKTSRKYTIPAKPEEIYVEQIGDYLAMKGETTGHIVVIYPVAGRSWDGTKASTLEIRSWKVTMTEADWNEYKQTMLDTRNKLSQSIAGEISFKELPLCYPFLCGSVFKGKVESVCPYYDKCQPEGRYPTNKLIQIANAVYREKVKKAKEEKANE